MIYYRNEDFRKVLFYNKMPQKGWLSNTTSSFLTVVETGKAWPRHQQVAFWWGFFLPHGQSLLTASSHGGKHQELSGSLISTDLTPEASTLRTWSPSKGPTSTTTTTGAFRWAQTFRPQQQPWANQLPSLSFGFFIYKMGIKKSIS